MAATTTITNVSNQIVPILINSISASDASSSSTIPASRAEQLSMQPGSKITVETVRISIGQLEQLRKKNVITY